MDMEKLLVLGLVNVLLVSGFGITLGSSRDMNEMKKVSFTEGNGTKGDPYLIKNITHLQNMNEDLSAHYRLANDIDASETENWNDGKGFAPIGNWVEKFVGTMDGQGHEIRGLHINNSEKDDVGLFGIIDKKGSVCDIKLLQANVTGRENVGGLVGLNYGTVENSYAEGNVSGKEDIGGLVGDNNEGTVNNSSAIGEVRGDDAVGGLAGSNYGTLNGSYAKGKVKGTSAIGGLVGNNEYLINHSYATGDVSGKSVVGGLVGENSGILENSFSSGNVSGNRNCGALLGSHQGTINNSYYNIDEVWINGNHHITIGGLFNAQYQDWKSNNMTLNIENYNSLVSSGEYYEIDDVQGMKDLLGFADREEYKFCLVADIDLPEESGFYIPYFTADFDGNGYVIKNFYFRSSFHSKLGFFGYLGEDGSVNDTTIVNVNVSCNSDVGGLVGYNHKGTIANSCTQGIVRGKNEDIGGLVGDNYKGTITKSYSLCSVSGESDIGGLVGYNYHGMITRSFARGDVYGTLLRVGGLVGGEKGGSVTHSYAMGNVSGRRAVGGLVGDNNGMINNSYAIGIVSGNSSVGGLVGDNYPSGSVNNSFWDMNTTKQSSSPGRGTGKTTAEMKNIETFTNESTEGLKQSWDFADDPEDDSLEKDIWDINEYNQLNNGYPFLRHQVESDTTLPTVDAGEDKTVEVGEELTIDGSNSSDNVAIDNYTWAIGGEKYYGMQVNYSFSNEGTYDITLTVEDEAGNTENDTITITVEKKEKEEQSWLIYLAPTIIFIVVIAGLVYWKSTGMEFGKDK